MGKGNRNRNDRYEDVYSMSSGGTAVKKSSRTGAKKDRTTVLLIALIAALLLSFVAIFVLSDTGMVERGKTYADSENFEVTGTMLSCYETLTYQTTFDYYYSMFSQNAADENEAYQNTLYWLQMIGFDPYKDAFKSAKSDLALAEKAKENGMELTAEDKDDIEATLASAKISAFGKGVKKKDLRAMLELQTLAAKYAETLEKEITDGATEEVVRDYVNAHKETYFKADILKYELSALHSEYKEDAAGLIAAEKLIDEYVAKLKASTSDQEFKKNVIGFEVYKLFDLNFEKNKGSIENADEEILDAAKSTLVENIYQAVVLGEEFVSSLTDNAIYAEAFEKVANNLYATCTSVVANLDASEAYTLSTDDEILSWISNEDTKAFATNAKDTKTTEKYSYTVYMVVEPMHVDESATKDVAHILIKAAKDTATAEEKAAAKEKAEKVLAEFKAGEQTLEAFEKLAETYNEDGGCVYEDVTAGRMVAEFNDWIYDDARVVGDTDVVETEYGYHVMYFIGDGAPAYFASAKSAYEVDEYDERVAALVEASVTINEKAIAKRLHTEDTAEA